MNAMNALPHMPQALVLSVGLNPVLMKSRSAVLRAQGYAVQAATSLDAALQAARGGDFDVVVICHTVPESDRRRLITAIRSAKPSLRIIVVRESASAPEADASVHGLDGPQALAELIATTLKSPGAHRNA